MAPEIVLRNYVSIGIFLLTILEIFLMPENRQEHTTARLHKMKYSHFVTFVIIDGFQIAWKSGIYDRPRENCWLAHLYTPGFPQDLGINEKHMVGITADNNRIMSKPSEAKAEETENIFAFLLSNSMTTLLYRTFHQKAHSCISRL